MKDKSSIGMLGLWWLEKQSREGSAEVKINEEAHTAETHAMTCLQ